MSRIAAVCALVIGLACLAFAVQVVVMALTRSIEEPVLAALFTILSVFVGLTAIWAAQRVLIAKR
jgi:hypothetical protein